MTQRQILISGTYTLTVFVSALLLFVVQPLSGEMILPLLGGSSAVWTTVMLFFQVLLLAGYVYAHGIAQSFPTSTQVRFHIAVVLLALLFLPVSIPETVLWPEEAPAISLIAALMIGLGPPTFVVSSSAPLLQHWFGALDHPDADDPYYLYAASNAGSLIALLSYPFLIERFLTLQTQNTGWAAAFVFLTLLTGSCGLLVFTSERANTKPASGGADHARSLSMSRRAWWVLITFIPSSLMLGVTHYLTMDIASVPLLWVIPLAVYLLTFILVFARIKHPLWLYRSLLPPAIFVTFALSFADVLSITPLIVLHVTLFFLVALYFHGELAKDRPHVSHLTEYYIYMSLGGSLGGVFNALIAPALFDSLVEYVLIMGVSFLCFVRHPNSGTTRSYFLSLGPLVLAAAGCVYFFVQIPFHGSLTDPEVLSGIILLGILFGTGAVIMFRFRSPLLINSAFGLLLLFGFSFHQEDRQTITRERSFYGQYELFDEGDYRHFLHGTTLHGLQKRDDGSFVHLPVGYYHPSGPFGDLFRSYDFDRVGIAGLGTGGLAPYHEEGDEFHFFEIDPAVERLARSYFGYLDTCGSGCRVHIGDARKLLENRTPGLFDVLFMDAYSSDAIPTHLLTREAVQLYLSRVTDDGLVVLHISNRHFNLERVAHAIAEDLDVHARVKTFVPFSDSGFSMFTGELNPIELITDSARFPGATLSEASSAKLVVLSKNRSALEPLIMQGGWTKLSGKPLLWTDNYTNIIPLLFSG